jgi:hypothetical protein
MIAKILADVAFTLFFGVAGSCGTHRDLATLRRARARSRSPRKGPT